MRILPGVSISSSRLPGASTAFSHSISLLLIALTVHAAHHVITCDHAHEHPVSYGLQVASTGLIFVIGLSMLWAACRGKTTTCGCAHHRGATASGSQPPANTSCQANVYQDSSATRTADRDSSPSPPPNQGLVQLARISPAIANPTTGAPPTALTTVPAGAAGPESAAVSRPAPKADNYRTTALLGIAIGLLPCPSALAAYLSSLSAGQPATAYWTILLFSLGIGVSLTCVGWGLQWLGAGLGQRLHRWQHLPWAHLRAALILMVAVFYATRL